MLSFADGKTMWEIVAKTHPLLLAAYLGLWGLWF
jgi:hypothetical protein